MGNFPIEKSPLKTKMACNLSFLGLKIELWAPYTHWHAVLNWEVDLIRKKLDVRLMANPNLNTKLGNEKDFREVLQKLTFSR